MQKQTTLKKIMGFFLTKIIIGIVVVGGSVALVEFARQSLPAKFKPDSELMNGVVGVAEILAALISYIFLFRVYEKRQIEELSAGTFFKNSLIGFFTGLALQSLIIFTIYLAGYYFIIKINPASFLIPGFIAALIAGFIMEILLRGIIFRLTEQKLGTVIALIISVLIFVLAHSGVRGATVFSVFSTAVQAGILFSAVYIYSRSLWLPIFLHFAWDFAEPGIFGAINPGIRVEKTLFNSKIIGPELVTGGQFGPTNSIQSTIFCLLTGLLFLWLAKKKNNFKQPYWKK